MMCTREEEEYDDDDDDDDEDEKEDASAEKWHRKARLHSRCGQKEIWYICTMHNVL